MIKLIINIFSYHGLIYGILRLKDQFFQHYLFDKINKVDTSEIRINTNLLNNKRHKWYQPCFFNPVLEGFKYISKVENLTDKEVSFIDLGCGKGKPSIIFSKIRNEFRNYGIDSDPFFQEYFYSNLKKFNKENYFINLDVNEIKLEKLKSEIMIVFHMNTLDPSSLLNFIKKYKKIKTKKKYFVLYNPEFKKPLKGNELIYFKKEGWHKLWGLNIYSIK